jgi:hypothetical protein
LGRGERSLKLPTAENAVPAKDLVSGERHFTEVGLFANPLAEFVAPPAIGHHAETPAAVIADLERMHHALPQQINGISLR